MHTHGPRSLLAEFGVEMPLRHKQLLKLIQGKLVKAERDGQ